MKGNSFKQIARRLGIRGFVGAVLLLPLTTGAQAAMRQVVHCFVPAVVRELPPIDHFPGTNRLNLAIGLPQRNQGALTSLLRQIYDPTNPNYHHYLTPQQFTERFGPTKKDYHAVIAFAQANGLQVIATHPNRMLVDVNGSVADIEKALHLTMHVYRHPTEKRLFHAPDAEPSLDLAVPVSGIIGLDDYSRPRPRLQATLLANTQSLPRNTGSGLGGTYVGKDFRAAYVPDSSLDGSGQIVGLLEFDGYNASDITYYENQAGLPAVTLTNMLIDGASGNPSGDGGELEVSLDIDMAISMATNLSQVVVYIAPNSDNTPWEDLLNRMANDNVAKQLSCSWYQPGATANPVTDGIFQQMAAQGQSFFTSSGDYDAYTGLIPFPEDSPYITQVGGATLTTSGPGGSWVSETVWNRGNVGSGGGISTQYPIPGWQTNINMSVNGGSTTMRNTPDVALTADNVYVRADGADYQVSGTSCAAPLWASFTALINQLAVATGQPTAGFMNPQLDAIGTGPNYTSAFHDITTGNNTSFSSPTRFYAVSGYDLCTGWGTPAGQNLIIRLAIPEISITPASGFSSIGLVGGPFTIASQSFSLTNLGKSPVSWSLINTSLWLNACPGGGTLTPGGPAATLTASLNSVASNLLVGIYNATLWFTNLTTGIGQSRQFVLNIGSPPVITQQPTNQTVVAGGTATFNVVVSSAGPCTYQWQLNGNNLLDNIITTVAGNGTAKFFDYVGMATNALLNSPSGVAADGAGNLFIADTGNNCIRQVDTNGIITTVAGSGSAGYTGDGGAATNASLDSPYAVAVDGADNLFIADLGNNCIRQVDANGIITTVVGTGSADYAGDGGPATNASLSAPSSVAVDAVGDLFIADTGNDCIRKVDTNGIITTVAGNGSAGYTGDGGAATNASLGYPFGVAVDGADNLFIADTYNDCIREVDVNGVITTVAGNGSAGYAGDGGAATNAILEYPFGVAVDAADNLFIADTYNYRIREVDTNAIITTVAGSGSAGYAGDGGPAANASLSAASVVAVDGIDNLFIADTGNNRIRKVALSGSATTGLFLNSATTNDAGNYTVIIDNAWGSVTSSIATLTMASPPTITSQPQSLLVSNGSQASFTVMVSGTGPFMYQWQKNQVNLTDGGNLSGSATTNLFLNPASTNDVGNYIVIINNAWGSVTSSVATLTMALPPTITSQPQSLLATNGSQASFTVMVSGTGPFLYQWQKNQVNLTDGGNLSGSVTTNLFLNPATTNDAGNYTVIIDNAWGSVTSSVADLTILIPPPVITQQPTNQTVVAGDSAIFSVALLSVGPCTYQWQLNGSNLPDNIISTVAGNGTTNYFGDDGMATYAGLDSPSGVAVDGYGNLFIADTGDNCIRQVDTNGIITTVVGIGSAGYAGDGGAATNATLSAPSGVAVDGYGNLFIADTGNNCIRQVDTNGIITTVAGIGSAGYTGDGGAATNATLSAPSGVAVDGYGNLFIADTGNNCIRQVDTNGIITTVVGNGSAGYAGDGSPATNASLTNPSGVAVDGYGNLFIADTGNNCVRQVDTNGIITTVAGIGSIGYAGDGSAATNAILDYPFGVAVDAVGNLFIADADNFRIRQVDTNGVITTVAGSGSSGYAGDGAPAVNASLSAASGVSVDGTGNLFIADTGNNRIREVASGGSPTLTLNNITTNDVGNYIVIINNAWGSVTSSVATLTVVLAPIIISQPQSLLVTNGSQASFTVMVSGTGPFLYQWQKNQVNLTDGGNLSGSVTTNLFLNPATTNDAGNYTVIIGNEWDSVTSSVAALTVVSQPVITQQPTNQTAAAGGTATFSVVVLSAGPCTYQWNFNNINISGATNSSLVLNNVQLSQAGTYAVTATNLFGSILSSNAVLTVTPDHFTWGQIPSPRFVNAPFSVAIQAQDTTNGVLTNFTGNVLLDSTNGVAAFPALAGNFIQGVWTGAVEVSQTVTNLVLRATDGFGHTGLANPINIVTLPPLNLRVSGNTLLLAWPADYSGFVLETSGSLSPAVWTVVPVSPVKIGNQYLVPFQLSGNIYFYRLRFSGP